MFKRIQATNRSYCFAIAQCRSFSSSGFLILWFNLLIPLLAIPRKLKQGNIINQAAINFVKISSISDSAVFRILFIDMKQAACPLNYLAKKIEILWLGAC